MIAPTPSLLQFQKGFAARLLSQNDGAVRAPGFEVHRSNVQLSLRQVLEATFPVVRRLVGRAFFAVMADNFVTAEPPRRGWLSAYGAGFPLFVDGYRPADGLAYLGDVARLEWARVRAAHAEFGPELDLAALTRLAADVLASRTLALHSAASLVVSRFPVFDIWSAHQASGEDDLLPPIDLSVGAQTIVVTRSEPTSTTVALLGPGDTALLQAAAAGLDLGEACQAAVEADEGYDLGAALARWSSSLALATTPLVPRGLRFEETRPSATLPSSSAGLAKIRLEEASGR